MKYKVNYQKVTKSITDYETQHDKKIPHIIPHFELHSFHQTFATAYNAAQRHKKNLF